LEQLGILETLGKCKEVLSIMKEEEVFESLLNLAVEKTIASKGAFLWQGRDASTYLPRAQRGLMVSQLPPLLIGSGQGIAGAILSKGSPAILGPILEDDPSSVYLGRNSTLILPMERKKTIWGGLILADKLSGEPFTDRDIRSLIPIATLVPLELGAEREKEAQPTAGRKISLDELADQGTLEALVDKETNKSKRYRRNFSLILVNLDELRDFLEKSIALSSEEILQQLHVSLLNTIRSADIAALMENGEVGLLAPETNYQGAIATARRIRLAIQGLPIMRGLALPSPFPIAFGIACFPEHGSSKDELLDRARQAMRRAAESAARFENLWGYMDKLLAEARITSELLGALAGSEEKKEGEELVSLPRDSDQLLPTGEHSKELQYLASWEDFQSFSQYIEERVLERLAGEGIFYMGTKARSQLQPKLEKYYRMRENGVKVFLFTQEEWEDEEQELRDIVLVVTEDPALAGYSFHIYYGVSACYALVGRQREEEVMSGFFTISDFLVNELMGKITETYL
jgi:diguanylate cyclase (GGDEF)-like protein